MNSGTVTPCIAFGASAHSRDGYPIDFRPCTLMDFVIVTGSALKLWAYFRPSGLHTVFGLHKPYGMVYSLPVYMHDCVVLTLLQVPTRPSGPLVLMGFHLLPRKRECVQIVRSFNSAW